MVDEFDQFRQVFFEECDELLQRFEDVAVRLTPGANEAADLDEMFRAVHSIKAGAGAFKFQRLVDLSHELESYMDRLRSGALALGEGDPEMVVEAGDFLQDLVAAARSGEEAEPGLESALVARLKQILGSGSTASPAAAVPGLTAGSVQPGESGDPAEAAGVYRVSFRPHRALFESANEPQMLFLALSAIGQVSVTADVSRIGELEAMDPMEGHLSWTLIVRNAPDRESIAEVFEFVDGDCDLEIEEYDPARADTETVTAEAESPPESEAVAEPAAIPEPAAATSQDLPVEAGNRNAAAPAQTSIRVDLNRVDRLVDMVGELVIAQAMALESLSELVDIRHVRQLQALEDLNMRTRELQEGVMAVRMQPLKAVFSRFPRIVRDLSKKLGKSVNLELEGEATEVDKTIIEELSDPLTHMIRNCMDHGIETPEDRLAAGKSERGRIRLSAENRNGRILIRVSDDGRGLNPEKVVRKAVENGLVPEGSELSKEEIENLIFMPGFSTAAEVSDVSGRGVGMDVVRRNIQKLGGRVTLDSTPGEGSTFTLALPLTLAVLDGMLISVAEERYVIPLSSIVETVCPEQGDMRDMPDGGTVMSLRGDPIRLVDVAAALGISRVGKAEALRKLVVVAETEFGRRIGLVVDELLGQQQVVIKSLETNYRAITGVAGTAILGDGRVRLILDIDGLAASDRGPVATREPARHGPAEDIPQTGGKYA